ncbi:hypothetical protein D3C86_1459040 [compost metagenome]
MSVQLVIQDRWLDLNELLRELVAQGFISQDSAEHALNARRRHAANGQMHPLEFIASQHLDDLSRPGKHLDLESLTSAKNISINSLWNGKSWILHPAEVACSVSSDGKNYFPVGKIQVAGEQQKEDPIRNYLFQVENKSYRYVKIAVKGTKKLFNWHPSAGEPSWFFLDEISVH